MPQYVIERTAPGVGGSTAAALQGLAEQSLAVLRDLGGAVQWVHSYVVDDKLYCVYNARDADLVREHARRGGFPADSVAEVRAIIDGSTAEDGPLLRAPRG